MDHKNNKLINLRKYQKNHKIKIRINCSNLLTNNRKSKLIKILLNKRSDLKKEEKVRSKHSKSILNLRIKNRNNVKFRRLLIKLKRKKLSKTELENIKSNLKFLKKKSNNKKELKMEILKTFLK